MKAEIPDETVAMLALCAQGDADVAAGRIVTRAEARERVKALLASHVTLRPEARGPKSEV